MTEVQVTHDYTAQADDELSLKVGEIITGITKVADGWCEGILNGRRGLFPDNFVRQLPPKSEKSVAAPRTIVRPNAGGVSELRKQLGSIIGGPPPAAARGLKKINKKVKVTNPYTSQHEDELTLEIGSIVEVLKTDCEDGWWEGSVNGRVGMFPNNFVELLPEDPDDKTPGDSPQEIKGRKVEGVGFGNIFAGAPIVLRSAKKDPVPVPTSSASDSSKGNGGNVVSGGASDARMSVKLKGPGVGPGGGAKSEPIRAKVLFAYVAENEDELSLGEGQVITVLDQDLEDKGWWKGELGGKVGVFPDNFVEVIPPTVEEKPKKPSLPPNAAKSVDVVAQKKDEPVKPGVAKAPWAPPSGAPAVDKKIAKIPPDTKVESEDFRAKLKASSDSSGSSEKLNSQPTGVGQPSANQKLPAQKPPGRPAVGPSATDETRRGGDSSSAATPTSPSSRPMARFDSKDSSVGIGGGVIGAGAGSKVQGGATVTGEQFAELQREVVQLREAIEQTRKSQEKRFLELMTEIDEEKKTRLSLQVEIDRLKKFLTPPDK